MLTLEQWLQTIITVVLTLTGSTGFWAYMQHRDKKKSQSERLLQGLAYFGITSLGMGYIERGWITSDEYDDFRRYFYDPYIALGGNGVTRRIMAAIDDLPIMDRSTYGKIIRDAKARGPRDTNDEHQSELAEAA